MIYPTPGRIVWFHPPATAAYPKVGDQPHPAMIAHVLEDGRINLTVSAPSGDTYAAREVHLLQDGEPAPIGQAYAEWMPYQKGQAAKAELLEAHAASKGTGSGGQPQQSAQPAQESVPVVQQQPAAAPQAAPDTSANAAPAPQATPEAPAAPANPPAA